MFCRVSSVWKNHGNLENELGNNRGISKNPLKPGNAMQILQIFRLLLSKCLAY